MSKGRDLKRFRKEPNEQSRKRSRLDSGPSKSKSHKGKVIGGGQIVPIDDLAWQAVQLPDQLEDAEGFYGLEEIEGVEVLRDGGETRYRVVDSASMNGDQKGSTKREPSEIVGDGTEDVAWEGFDDEVPVEAPVAKSSTASVQAEQSKETKKRRKDRVDTQVNGNHNGKKAILNEFAALEESGDEGADVSEWLGLGLSAYTLAALAKLKFSNPTPIQKAAIPDILAGEDVIGKASTGSGKTLAFGLPIIDHILASKTVSQQAGSSSTTALILSPTRELAHQISQHIIDVCTNLSVEGPRVATITGGLSIQKQERLLAKADIVIGTPGRLWEVMGTVPGSLKRLKQVRFLVADEADRLLSEGHFKEVEEILAALDKQEINEGEEQGHNASSSQRQTLVFSATFQKDLQKKLAGRIKATNNLMDNKHSLDYLMQKLNFRSEPRFIDVNPVKQMASNLREGLLECGAMEKDLYLYALLLQYSKARILVFTNSISSVRRLTPLLQNLNIKPYALHSEMPQKARLRSVERFSDSSMIGSILIATDVAARGLDIPSVDVVIHYHVPRAAGTYVHRSGRTARASSSGTSIMLCAPEETIPVQRLISKIHIAASSTDELPPLSTLSLDRTLLNRLKPRITLSASLVSANSSKSKTNSDEIWLRKAAEDLGVDYSSDEFAETQSSTKNRGRGRGREKATRDQAASTSKEQIGAWKAELKDLLAKRVNVGVSEKYLTAAAGLDIDALLKEREKAKAEAITGLAPRSGALQFLGSVDAIRGWN